MRKLTRLFCLFALAAGCAGPSDDAPTAGVDIAIEQPLVLESDVRLPGDDARFLGVSQEADGRFRFRYEAEPEIDFAVGDVLVGNEDRGYQGRVLDIATDGFDRLVTLEPVGLDEVLAEGAFTVRAIPEETELRPVAEDGVGSRSDALLGTFDLVPQEILDGAGSCEGVAAGQIRFKHHLQTRGLDTKVTFDTSGFSVNRAGVTVSGGATLTLELETNAAVDAQCALDVIDALNRQGVGIRPVEWTKSFRVGGILPMSIAFQMTPQLLTEASVFVEPTAMTAAIQVSADMEAGVMYESGRGVGVDTDLTRDVAFDLDLEEGGDARAQADLHAGLYIRLDINRLQLPHAGAELDAHASVNADDAACTYDWNASVRGEVWLRGEVGVDLGFFSRTFADLNERIGFSESASGGDDLELPYCEPDMCTTDADCVGIGETCQDGVCVEDMACDCAAGEVCSGGFCVPDPAGIVTCDECALLPGMGWCMATNECVPEAMAGDCGGDFASSRSACIACDGYTTCGDCAGDGFCGWIASEGRCVNDALHRDSVPPADYVSTPSWCG